MLKRKILIPAAAIMAMSSSMNVLADENEVDNKYNEITYKVATVTPKIGLNVRSTPELNDQNKIFAVSKGTKLDVVGEQNGWYKVELENNKFGWVNSRYIELTNEDIYVNVDRLNFRSDKSLKSNIYQVLEKGTKIELIDQAEDWLRVKYNGKEGYVYSKYVTDEKPEVEVGSDETISNKEVDNRTQSSTTSSSKPSSNDQINTSNNNKTNYNQSQSNSTVKEESTSSNISSSNKQSAIVSLAKAQIGKPYVWGAEGPSSFDCSGLTSYVYKNAAGISIPRTSTAQSTYGTTVSRSNLKPGDLIFSSTNGTGKVSHVGIYIGNGEMIHAPKPGDVVKKTNINSDYWNDVYLWAKRVL